MNFLCTRIQIKKTHLFSSSFHKIHHHHNSQVPDHLISILVIVHFSIKQTAKGKTINGIQNFWIISSKMALIQRHFRHLTQPQGMIEYTCIVRALYSWPCERNIEGACIKGVVYKAVPTIYIASHHRLPRILYSFGPLMVRTRFGFIQLFLIY